MNILRFSGFVLLGSLLLTGCAAMKKTQDFQTGQHEKNFSGIIQKKVSMNYLLYLPDNYGQTDAKFPLVLFLHGSGERGDDLSKVIVHGPPKLVSQGHKFPFVLVSPQCPDNQWWDIELLKNLVDNIISEYNIDKSKIYVTGLSMGGFGTWDLAMAYPNMFAAIAPVCGGGNDLNADVIKDVPAWVFHGAKDNVVPPERSEKMVEALKKCGGDVKFTLYPEANHDSWTKTYENEELYKWLLSKSR